MEKSFWNWRQTVLERVRFAPDRPAISKELTAHYEDHVRDLERLGYETDLARERALQAMGDAETVGAALDLAHKPWLGWLWRLSRWLLCGLLVMTVAVLVFSRERFQQGWERTRGQLEWTEPAPNAERLELAHGTLYAAPGPVWEEEGRVFAEVELWLETRSPRFDHPSAMLGYLQAADDRGRIPAYQQSLEDYTWPTCNYWKLPRGTWISWTRYQWTMELYLDHTPRWVELSYPYGGNAGTLRVEWEVEK